MAVGYLKHQNPRGTCFACNKRAQGAKEFRSVQELRKQIKIKKMAYAILEHF